MCPLENDLSEISGGPADYDGEFSMWEMAQRGSRKDPDRTALVSAFQAAGHLEGLVGPSTPTFPAAGTVLNWSYRQLALGAVRLASVLDQYHFPPGSALTVFCGNRAELHLITWLCHYRGFKWSSLELALLQPDREEELKYYLGKLKPTMFVVADAETAKRVDTVRQSLGAKPGSFAGISCSSTPEESKSWLSLSELAKTTFSDEQSTPRPTPDHKDRIVMMSFTSGSSTGKSKGIESRVSQWIHVAALDFAMNLSPNNRNITVAPNSRMIFFGTAFSTFALGATLVFPAAMFQPQALLDSIEKFQGDVMYTVPQLLPILINHPSFSSEKIKSLKLLVAGGDVVTSPVYHSIVEAFPDAVVLDHYGLTEGGAFTGWRGIKTPQPYRFHQEIATVGKVLKGSSMRVVDRDGRIVKRGVSGEIHLTGVMMSTRYMDNEKPEDFYEDDGKIWFKTGDVGCIDQEGWVYVGGRFKDIIRTKLDVIIPGGIEACIRKHLRVQCLVVGVPSGKYDELPWAVVGELPGGKSTNDADQIVTQEMGAEYHLAGVSTLAQIGLQDWPRDAWGKLSIREVKGSLLKHLRLS